MSRCRLRSWRANGGVEKKQALPLFKAENFLEFSSPNNHLRFIQNLKATTVAAVDCVVIRSELNLEGFSWWSRRNHFERTVRREGNPITPGFDPKVNRRRSTIMKQDALYRELRH
jgi:hypothetical protein